MATQIYTIPTNTCIGIGCKIDDTVGYELLYNMKGRDKAKPMAILVPTWEDLAYESKLSPTQINFLKTYKFPFTIVSDVNDDFKDEYPILEKYNYKTVGFRVAENCLPSETVPYIRSPLFLTSANKSGKEECHTINEVKEVFHEHAELLKILPGTAGCQPSSNVIQFIGTTNDLKYIRKNYPLSSK